VKEWERELVSRSVRERESERVGERVSEQECERGRECSPTLFERARE